jgi:hypothetical protein
MLQSFPKKSPTPRVESERGAIGLMGIVPDVWLEELQTHGIVRKLDDLYTISSNINSGIYVAWEVSGKDEQSQRGPHPLCRRRPCVCGESLADARGNLTGAAFRGSTPFYGE